MRFWYYRFGNSQGSGETAHMCSLVRPFAGRIHKRVTYMKTQAKYKVSIPTM